jgi:hypothetical protein
VVEGLGSEAPDAALLGKLPGQPPQSLADAMHGAVMRFVVSGDPAGRATTSAPARR